MAELIDVANAMFTNKRNWVNISDEDKEKYWDNLLICIDETHHLQMNEISDGVYEMNELSQVVDYSFKNNNNDSSTIKTDNKSVILVTTGQRFRLIGNPYSSSISSKDILERSTVALDTETIWIWDQSANSGAGAYLTKVASADFKIAPSQGFFVQAHAYGGNVLIEPTDRVHASGTFRRTVVRPEIYLNLSD